ncbi:phosphate acetyltransferase [Lysinibacter sp. HNR]|uniref:phosphate acetyltransferase n=1 Tax=Lysinibacter sp. HNR TaxID=3031408 RepID=UPI002434F250|nr:phosphate acetyltransferase [Lysinibacter sp. HNR]WGD37092.1 phosphate acetyltransferase [Lysinibacter sp. HNR]
MARSIYITSAEGHSGKSTVALGILNTLIRSTPRVAVFRPIARSTSERDYVLDMLNAHATAGVPYDECVGTTYEEVHADPEEALSRIVERFKAVEARSDAVIILGSDYTDVGSPTELSYNARIAANLGAPVLLVLGGRKRQGSNETLGQSEPRSALDMNLVAEVAASELRHEHATLLAVIVNRADTDQLEPIKSAVEQALNSQQTVPGHESNVVPVWTIPEDRYLVAPSVGSVMEAVDGTLLRGDPKMLGREALSIVVAGMSMENVLPRILEGSILVIPGDRSEVLLAVLLANESATFPSISGVILNGGFTLPESVQSLLDGINSPLPIIATGLGTYDTALRITHTRGRLAADSPRKFDNALSLFEDHVDGGRLVKAMQVHASQVLTPIMFAYGLFDRARRANKHIVLPEGSDDRILRAASTLLKRGVVRLTILGDPDLIHHRAAALGLDITKASIIDPAHSDLLPRFAEEYARLRAHKGATLEQATDAVTDVSYFGTMMVHLGLADGMVSGAAHTTAHTIRPSFEIIKTEPGVSIVSSVFLMALADRVLVYGDCAVNPDPTSEQLADIAISSAATAAQFGIEPRVAMLSYSTGESGSGADVEKVREATRIVRERRPDLLVEGPIQYDAAADVAVAASKLPDSQVAGRATVFIFPDLNTGNNTYKAVQRSAGATAVGPVLQGLRKPVNDLSRGALVEDILNTVAITAIQADAEPTEPEITGLEPATPERNG